ncbi:MAG TPA: DUF1801 domain-containing protein [Anaerolineales bacterium]|nr:DUF1801 domain-containing protein [Anaerolineales bacterium]
MAELKTRVNRGNVHKFLEGIRDEKKRAECYQILKIMKRATKAEPKMWGMSIVGFGDHHYTYESGRESDWFLAGFAPRMQNLTIYMMGDLDSALLKKLGKYKTGKGCLYINQLEDVDTKVLKALIAKSVKKISEN